MKFDYFKQQSKTENNWSLSAINVGIWNVIITVRLAVPITSYVVALQNEPEYVSGKTWKREYTFMKIYPAKLYGTIAGQKITCEMKISQ